MKGLFFSCILFACVAPACAGPTDEEAADDVSEAELRTPLHCRGANVIRERVPVDPQRPGGAGYSYAFKLFPSTSGATATTVIVLNGGPGATTMEFRPDEFAPTGELAYPLGAITTAQFNVVYTDQRGSGCNDVGLPERAITTDAIAADVLAIVRRLRLTNWIVYGASYGTVQATRVAHLAPRMALAPPKAVVLEGVMGKSPNNFDGYVAGYDAEWQELKRTLPPRVSASFDRSPLPLGASPQAWGGFLQGQLLLTGHAALRASLLPLSTGNPTGLAELGATLAAIDRGYVDYASNPRFSPPVEIILCTELFGGSRHAALVGGRLVAFGGDRCSGRAFAPYDSARYPVPSPIYYIQGDDDPATTLVNALHHYESQRGTYRAFITVPRAAHGPLSFDLRSRGCSPSLWSAIDRQNGAAFGSAVASCGEVHLQGRTPGQ